MTFRTALLFASITGFLAVVAGTFGAHGLEGRVSPELLETYEVGARYHAYHALAMLACAGFVERLGRGGGVAVVLFAVGTAIFAGTLYALAITGQRWLGAVTPIGGLALLGGWATLITAAWKHARTITSAERG